MTEDPPPVGAVVHLEVDLETSRQEVAVNIRAKGVVNQLETTNLAGRLGGFAVSTRRMKLEKPNPSTTK